jgi:hypothetical protein
MRTTQTVKELALYASLCCNQEVLFDREDCFSRCPGCEELCSWQMVEPVISWIDLEARETLAA